jgi:hypothetical protein
VPLLLYPADGQEWIEVEHGHAYSLELTNKSRTLTLFAKIYVDGEAAMCSSRAPTALSRSATC